MGFLQSKLNYKERNFTKQPLEDEEIDVIIKQISKDDIIERLDQEDMENIVNKYSSDKIIGRLKETDKEIILRAMSDQKVFNIRGDSIFDYYFTNNKDELKSCMTSHINQDNAPCEDEKFKKMIETIPNLVLGPLGEKKSQWDTEKNTLQRQWDTEKNTLQSQWDTEKNTLQSQLGTEKNTLQTQWDSDKQKWDTEKNTLQTQWDSDKQKLNKEKNTLQRQWNSDKQKWDTEKNTLQTQWDSDKQKWDTEKNTLQTKWDRDKQKWDTEKNTLRTQWDSDKQKWNTEKNTLQTQYDNDKQKWNTEKNTLQTQWDSDKQKWNTEKNTLQTQWDTEKNTLQTQWDTEKNTLQQKLKPLVKKDFSQISSNFKPFANNHSRYVNEKECLDYAISINSSRYTKQSWDTRLKGCSIDTKANNQVYFNTHETGLVIPPFEIETIKSPTDIGKNEWVGRYIAIGKKYAVVGFSGFDEQRGKAYIFEVSTGELKHTIEADDKVKYDNFGWRVAIGGPQGAHVIISAVFAKNNAGVSAAGALYVFGAERGGQFSKITVEDSDVATYDVLGESVDIDDGYNVIAGATGYGSGGAAYIFSVLQVRQPKQLHKLTVSGSKNFGCSVGISGDYAVVGDKEHGDLRGIVYIFKVSTGKALQKIIADDSKKKDYFGSAIGIDGNYIVVGAKGVDENKGAAYVFDTTTGKQLHKLTVSDGKKNDKFGDQHGVSISGKYAIIGAKGNDDNNGAAYIFNVETGELYKKLVGRDKEMFGWGVSIHGINAMIGAPKHNGNGKNNTGGIYFYTSKELECGINGQECITKALTKEDLTLSKDGKPQHNVVDKKYIPIMNEKECKEVSTMIGGPDVKWSRFKYSALPVGCLYRPSQNKFIWNTYTDNLYDCSDNFNCVKLK